MVTEDTRVPSEPIESRGGHTVSCPELFISSFFHFSLASRTGLSIPYPDVIATALQAQTPHLAPVGWSDIGNDTTHNNVLYSMAVRTRHWCDLLAEQATSLIHLSLVPTGLTAIFQFPGHLLSSKNIRLEMMLQSYENIWISPQSKIELSLWLAFQLCPLK